MSVGSVACQPLPTELKARRMAFFALRVRHLEQLARQIHEYHMIQASLIVRQLVVDRNSLAHVVNREFRETFTFRLPAATQIPLGEPESAASNIILAHGITPVEGTSCVDLDLQRFLATSVAGVRNVGLSYDKDSGA